jgi:hypothetical protein
MLQFARFRPMAIVFFAAAAFSLATASARAFTQETLRAGGSGNSAFADSTNGENFGRGMQPFGSNGPVVQFGARQGPLTPFGHFQGSGYSASPPDPYSRPLGNGN